MIKVEPPRGDLTRQAFPRTGDISGYYAQQNAGKRNISIDLNVAGARDVALKLCDTADIVVEISVPACSSPSAWGMSCRGAQSVGGLRFDPGYGQRGSCEPGWLMVRRFKPRSGSPGTPSAVRC